MTCGHKFEKSRWLFQIGKIQVGKIQIREKPVKIQTQHDPAKKSWTKKNPRSPSGLPCPQSRFRHLNGTTICSVLVVLSL